MMSFTVACVIMTSVLAVCVGEVNVLTVLIEPSYKLIDWPDIKDNASKHPNLNDYNSTSEADLIIREWDLVAFYNEVYSQSNALVVFVDLRHDACPIDLFRKHLLGYITTATTHCHSTSDVTKMATSRVETWSFDLMTFMSDFLSSWSSVETSGKSHASFALLFDQSGEDHFLLPNRKLTTRLLFEITLPLISCNNSNHVTDVAAKTNTKDVIVIATTSCIYDLLLAVSQLHLPTTRFRWLLYPTDHDDHFSWDGLSNFFNVIQPVLITEVDKPQGRPIYSQDKLLRFAQHGVQRFLATMKNEETGQQCHLNCTDYCADCQLLYQEKLTEIEGQAYEVFLSREDEVKRNMMFDLHRIASTGHIYLGNWSHETGLTINQPVYPSSLVDTQLSVVVIVEPPFIFRNESVIGEVSYYGYSMDVLKEIASRVGFSYTVRECDAGGYGLLEHGKWTGCIGNVVRGEADVILGALTVTAERDQVVDFTLPYYNFAGIQILMKKQAANIDLFYYANVFTTPAWLSLGAVVVATSLLLWAFEKVTSSETRKGHYSVNRTLSRTSSIPLSSLSANNGVSTITSNNNLTTGNSGDINNHTTGRVIANGNANSNSISNSNTSSSANNMGVHDGKPMARQGQGKNPSREKTAAVVRPDTVYTLGESIWFVIGALTMAGGGDPPRSLSGRLLIAGFWFFAVIMMSTFTANLAAFLTVSRMGMTISSLDDLAAQTDVKYSVVDQSSVMEYFQRMAKIEEDFYERWKTISLDRSEDDTQDSLAVWDYPLGNKYGAMWTTIQDTGLIKSNEVGLGRVKSENFALITESPLIQYYTDRNCELTAVGDQFSVRPYAIGLKERSPYTTRFSDAILELQKERQLGSLRLKWWTNNESSCPKDTGNTGLDLFSLSGTFIVAGAGVASGLIVLGLEHVISQLKKRRRSHLRARNDMPIPAK